MGVLALWSTPRSRSTAFFRSMVERGDLLALHEPFEGLIYLGPVDIGSCQFESPRSLVRWLLHSSESPVFLKETVDRKVLDVVRSEHRFLAEVHHGFLIRRPEEVAASFYALEGDMRMQDAGTEALYELYVAVREAGGHCPVVIDSDDLVARPEATMRAYCAEVGLPFVADALRWDAGARPEWRRTARWHEDVSASTGFARPDRRDRHFLASNPEVLRFASHHRPYYELLRAERLRVDDERPMSGTRISSSDSDDRDHLEGDAT